MVISEKFIGLEESVSDFWRWALSDWQSTGTRAQLAEYYVRRALGLEKEQAPEWEYVDIHMQNGTKIEVKSASLIPGQMNNTGDSRRATHPLTTELL